MLEQVGSITHAIMDKSAQPNNGITDAKQWLVEALKSEELRINQGREEFSSANGSQRRLSDAMVNYFDNLKKRANSPEEIQRIDMMRGKAEEEAKVQAQFYTNKIKSMGDKMDVEFALSAIKKTSSGIQTLLSAQ